MTKRAVTESVESVEVVETPVETEQESFLSSSIKTELDEFDVDGLKEVIEYCSARIDELQREEVEALEAEMRAIQDKLMAMRGHRGKQVVEKEKQKRTEKVVINPDNPTQVYKFGKTPDWLSALCAKTGKTVSDLRVDCPV